jgi:hypothetical protein
VTVLWILGGGLALVALVAALARRGRQRRAARLAGLVAAVRTAAAALDEPPDLELGADRLVARDTGAAIPHRRLLRAADLGHSAAAIAEAALLLLRTPLRPLQGPLALKIHGPRLRLCLLPAASVPLWPAEPRWAWLPIDALPLVATYRVDGRADACLTEDHLRERALDARDVHGIALAVLRQHFDEALVERLAAGPQTLTEDGDASTGAILVLADFLPPGLAVEAVLEAPSRLQLRRLPASPDPSPRTAVPPLRLCIEHGGRRIL